MESPFDKNTLTLVDGRPAVRLSNVEMPKVLLLMPIVLQIPFRLLLAQSYSSVVFIDNVMLRLFPNLCLVVLCHLVRNQERFIHSYLTDADATVLHIDERLRLSLETCHMLICLLDCGNNQIFIGCVDFTSLTILSLFINGSIA